MKSIVFMMSACMLSLATWADSPAVEFKNPQGLSQPHGYSHVVVVNRGKRVIVAGQVGLNDKGELQSDFAAQVKQAFANVKTALAAAGAKPSDLVRLNYYVVDLDQSKLMTLRSARDTLIDLQHPPASTLVGVTTLFRKDVLVEIEAEAVVP